MRTRTMICSLVAVSAATALAREDTFCKTYKRGEAPAFDATSGVWEQAFDISDAYPLGSMVVPIQVSHPSIADLRITLWAEAPAEVEAGKHKGTHLKKQVVLKEEGQGSGDFLQAIYADDPQEGAVAPVEGLAFLYRGTRPSVLAAYGGSEGTWTVRIENSGGSRPVVDANLVLCQIETGETTVVSDVVQAFAGSTQPVPADMPWTIDGEVVSEEELAAFRRAAALAIANVRDAEGNSALRGLFDNLKESTKTRLALFSDKIKNSTDSYGRWKPGQLASGALQGLGNLVENLGGGNGGGSLLAGPLKGEKPDKIIWSRAALPALESLNSLPSISKEALEGVADMVRSAGAELTEKLSGWSLDGLPSLPSLPSLDGLHGHLELPPLSLPSLPAGKIPTFDDVRSSLESTAEKISDNAQNWAEKRADQRESFLNVVESNLEGAKSKLEAGLGSLGSVVRPDLSGVKDKLTDSIAQVKERQKRLERPREEFKTMLSTAVENTVKQQLEAVAGQFDLDVIEQRLAEAGVDTDELLDSLSGADLDKLMDSGVDLNFRSGLSMDGALGEQVVGQLLGIDDPEELDALWNGLKEAGFQDLMGEFLMTAR